LLFAAVATAVSLAAWLFFRAGEHLNYGDAEAHLNIARRISDSITPGIEQIGTVWLPLPHVLTMPLANIDSLWHSGLAGTLVSSACAILAAWFLALAASRAYGTAAAGIVAALVFAFNPNFLYLASAPMTEPLFFACEAALLLSLVAYSKSGSAASAACAGLAAAAGALTRYDGWFLLPIGALIVFFAKRNLGHTLLFGVIAAAAPLYWFAHNRWFYGNWLEFYNGPYSPHGIQGDKPYPGRGDWFVALRYYGAASVANAGWGAIAIGAMGLAVSLVRRVWWPLLLAIVPMFYIASMHDGGSPIFLPGLWPNSYYNSRYGLAVLPLVAFAAGALAIRPWIAIALIAASVSPWFFYPRRDGWVAWKEAQVNGRARVAATHDAALFLREEYQRGDRVFVSFGDLIRVPREAGIPLRETIHEGNGLIYPAALARPDLFLWPRWVVASEGSPESRMARKRKYELVRISRSGDRTVEIFKRRQER
jgi:hypothetical protein